MPKIFYLLIIIIMTGCGSSVENVLDVVIDEPDRKEIDTSIMGANAFFNDGRFGSLPSQANEIRNTIKLRRVRVLFAWNDDVQPFPNEPVNFSFYDDIVNATAGAGLEVLVILTGVPSWMSDDLNWTSDNNPRKTFVDRWVRKVVNRYKNRAHIVAFEIWNEQNERNEPDNVFLDLRDSPVNYVEMLCHAYSTIEDLAPTKLVISGATTAINQNYPANINYNEIMRDNGAEDCADIYGVHIYGNQFENFERSGGVKDFLNGLSRLIWVTETGAQGINSQLEYAERMYPYLREQIPDIQRIYQYQAFESTPASSTYGLRNLTAGQTLSDLYIHLRDR